MRHTMRQAHFQPLRVPLLVLLLTGICLGADRPKRATIEKTAVNFSALPAGKKAMAAVVLEVKEGFHAQSHVPLDPALIPFTVKMNDVPGLSFGEIQYPPGKIEDYPALGKLSVYTARTI